MKSSDGARAALEPRRQCTRPRTIVARGYTPPRPHRVLHLALRLRQQARGQQRAIQTAFRPEGQVLVAFVAGLVMAACVFVPFLPRFAH